MFRTDLPVIHSIMPKQNPIWNKDSRRTLERFAKKHCEPLGDLLEAVNNLEDTKENINDTLDGKYLFRSSEKLSKGDHILVQRLLYAHHGIYADKNHVYQYDDNGVNVVTLEEFAQGDTVLVYHEGAHYTPSQIIKRAKSRLGENDYNLFINNCQNFATWCRSGS